MNTHNNHSWLDEAIKQSRPGARPVPDFDTWCHMHPSARDTLSEGAAPIDHGRRVVPVIALGRRIMQSPITKLVAAAVILVGLFVLTTHLMGRQAVEKPGQIAAHPNDTTVDQPRVIDCLASERQIAEQYFVRADLSALHQLMQAGLVPTQTLVATYLGQIGDEASIQHLQPLADQWQQKAGANPFAVAIKAIRARLTNVPEANEPNAPVDSTESTESIESAESVPSPLPLQVRGILSGRITDAQTGGPVVGAIVELSGPGWGDAVTDAQGYYVVTKIREKGNYRIAVSSKRYLGLGTMSERPVVALTPRSRVVRDFQLEPGCAVEIEVVDEQDRPVADVRVAGSWLGAERFHMDMGGGRTDVDGRIAVGAFKQSDIAYRLTARHNAYAPAQVTLSLTDPQRVEQARIVLRKGVSVQGYAEYADGMPAEGLSVFVKPDWWHSHYTPATVEVDVQGHFTIEHIVPGHYTSNVMFRRPDGGGTSYGLGHVELPLPEDEVFIVRIPEKSPHSTVTIKGKITWAQGQSVSFLDVSAYSSQTGVSKQESLHGRTDRFELKGLEPGAYTVRFSGTEVKQLILKEVQAPCDTLDVVLKKLAKPHLIGQVVDAVSQSPIEHFQARILKVGHLHGSYYIPSGNWHQFRDGRFDLEPVGPGIYQVQVMAHGYAGGLSQEISTDEIAPVIVTLSKGLPVRGTVTTILGEPVSGAQVIPLSLARGNYSQTSKLFVSKTGAVESRNGVFVLEHVPPGVESLKIVHPDYAPLIMTDIPVTASMSDLEIVLDRGATVEGKVYDAMGQAEQNVTLFVQDDRAQTSGTEAEATRLGVAVTDANGTYRVPHLPADQVCYVVRSDMYRAEGIVQRGCMPMRERTVRIDFGGQTVLQGMISIKNDPVADTYVHISGAQQSYSKAFRGNTRTDAYGRFVFRGVPAGQYGIFYDRPGTRGDTVRAAVVTVTGMDQDLGALPRAQGRVELSLCGATDAVDLSIWQVSMQEGTEFWSRKAGTVTKPGSPDRHYIIEGLLPGTHRIVATNGTIRCCKIVEVGDKPLTLQMTIPTGTASVSGRILGETAQSLILWNDDHMVTARVSATDNTYAIDALPSGHYTIGDHFLEELAPLTDFSVRAGEHRVIDLDLDAWQPDIGLLRITVVGSDGRFLTGGEVTLDDRGTKIRPMPGSSQGECVFAVTPGAYVLVGQCEGYALYTETVTVKRSHQRGAGFKRDAKVIVLQVE